MSEQNFLVTGATGFVGRFLLGALEQQGYGVRAAYRRAPAAPVAGSVVVGELGPDTAWEEALAGVDVVVHLAGLAHLPPGAARTQTEQFERINTRATLTLARACGDAGVRRLVFISSVKVNGERTHGAAFTEADIPNPSDAYARSKWAAEQGLAQVAAQTGLEVTVVRPPLVYGAGVKANFLQLMRWVDRGIPLPVASIHNQRSLIGIENLADALLRCAIHPAAAGETFLVSDGDDVSTPQLVQRLAKALGRQPRLFACPESLLRWAGRLSGRGAGVDRLLDSLQADTGKIQRMLGWRAPVTMEEGLAAAARWFKSVRHSTDKE